MSDELRRLRARILERLRDWDWQGVPGRSYSLLIARFHQALADGPEPPALVPGPEVAALVGWVAEAGRRDLSAAELAQAEELASRVAVDGAAPPYAQCLRAALREPRRAAHLLAENLEEAGRPWSGLDRVANQERAHATLLAAAECLRPPWPVAADSRWRTVDVLGITRAIRADRAFDRLPILADALMDAGCNDEAILAHCRSTRAHVPGCWVADLFRAGRRTYGPGPAGHRVPMRVAGVVRAAVAFRRSGAERGHSDLITRLHAELHALRAAGRRRTGPVRVRLCHRPGDGAAEFDGPFLVGRHPWTGLTLGAVRESSASRLHALVWADARGWWLVDLFSLNGTQLNGVRVGAAPAGPLRPRDLMQFGRSRYEVTEVGPAGPGRPDSAVARGLAAVAAACRRSDINLGLLLATRKVLDEGHRAGILAELHYRMAIGYRRPAGADQFAALAALVAVIEVMPFAAPIRLGTDRWPPARLKSPESARNFGSV